MKLGIATDHGGYEMKEEILKLLGAEGLSWRPNDGCCSCVGLCEQFSGETEKRRRR
jgi:hypothetical protein